MHGSTVYYAWPFSDSDAATPQQTHEMNAVRRRLVTGRKKITASGLVRRGCHESLFGPSGAEQQKAQDGCQNGQLWLAACL